MAIDNAMNIQAGTILRLKHFDTVTLDGNTTLSFRSPEKGKVFIALLLGLQDTVLTEEQVAQFDDELKKMMAKLNWKSTEI